jgi:hypothetical protein
MNAHFTPIDALKHESYRLGTFSLRPLTREIHMDESQTGT